MYKKLLRDFKLACARVTVEGMRVPCTLYRALVSAGELAPIDVGTNLRAVRTLSGVPFTVSCVISGNEELLSYKKVALRFHGVDAPCRVLLNGEFLCEITDAHLTVTHEIRPYLNAGENELCIVFSAAPRMDSLSYVGEGWSDFGLFEPVEIIGYNETFIDSVKFRQVHENGKVTLHIECKTYGESETPEIVASLVSPGGRMYYCGLHRGRGSLLITDPILWWPHTMGRANLYRVTLTMYVGGEPCDSRTVSLGLREVGLSFADPMGEREFAMTVGGERFFVSGAEFCPDSCLLTSQMEAHLESLIRSYVRANVNLLFVTEQNAHLPQRFYDLCDRYGILIMQDILPPKGAADSEEGTAGYLEVLRATLCEIATHPSIALLRSHLTEEDSIREIPSVLREEIPDAVYTNLYIQRDKPLSAFDTTSAFAPVQGCASFPSLTSLHKFVPKEQMNPYSETVELRSTVPVQEIFNEAAGRYPYAMRMEEVVYLSQLIQSDMIRESVEFLRLRRGRAMGALLVGSNDPLGRISSSVVDYYGAEKAVGYTLHDVYAPDALLLRRDGYRVSFFVSNETRSALNVTLVYRLLDAKNEVLREERVDATVEKDSLSEIHSADFSTLAHKREREVYVHASLLSGDTELHSATVLFTLPKRFGYVDPAIDAQLSGSGGEYTVTLTPRAFAHRVYLSFCDVDATFTQNFIDLTRNVPVRVRVLTRERNLSVESLSARLRVLSVYDIGNQKGKESLQ